MRRLSLLLILLFWFGCAQDSASSTTNHAGSSPAVRDGETKGASTSTGAGGLAATASSMAAGGAELGSGSAGVAAPASLPRVDGASGSGAMGSAASADADGGVLPQDATVPPALPAIPAGTLTAGTWDDNLNYKRFTSYRKAHPKTELPGLLPFDDQEFDDANAAHAQSQVAHTKLDIALLIDTTGSMGDEIAYLQREFTALSAGIRKAYPNADQRWALVLYRDTVDIYITRWFDFRTDGSDFNAKLAAQGADGGGDTPESPEKGFETLNQLTWRKDPSVARLAFWVADAPHHDASAQAMADAIRSTQANDIHVYPVAASGADTLTELSMRSAAQLTQGRYLFLTNDSGIGGDHKEPEIACYFVTSLTDAISRMVDVELSGKYHEPTAAQVLRTGGNPQDQSCELASGKAQVF